MRKTRPPNDARLSCGTVDPFERPDWMRRAACVERAVDPDIFFPRRGRNSWRGKAICATCPVKNECLEYGIRETYGIWGGTSDRDRRVIRQQRRQAEEIAS